MRRRELLKGAAAGGALLVARPVAALASPLGPSAEFSTSRASRLFPGTRLAHADLHNHSLHSDGDGDPAKAFASMRDAGLDIAALTDHSGTSWGAPADPCFAQKDCRSVAGIDEAAWLKTKQIADSADAPGAFTAIRGFEWSSPFLGHVNVWFSERWIDPLHTGGVGPEGIGAHLHENLPTAGPAAQPALDTASRANPAAGTGMALFYDWLAAAPSRPGIGGGSDALAGFNHPGREYGRFGYFRLDPAVRDRVVSMEVFNRGEDYLFEQYGKGQPSPLTDCLDAGWRVGMLGVTDEHGTTWGRDGRGRTGLWVNELSRTGVREAMAARRFFATTLRGLRVDAGAVSGSDATGGAVARMGSTLRHASGPVTFSVDVDRGPEWWGKPLQVQVLRSGGALPKVVHVEDVVVPRDDQPVISFTVNLAAADGSWVVLRIADPAAPNKQPGPAGHACNTAGVAYASPFWLQP